MKKITICIIFLIAFLSGLSADEKKSRLSGYPYALYTSETNFTFGLFGIYTHRTEEDKSIPANIVMINSLYSLKNQFLITVSPEFNFRRGTYSLSLDCKAKYWPSSYYGTGNYTEDADEEKYTPVEIGTEIQLKKKILGKFYLAESYNFMSYSLKDTEDDGLLSTESIPGSEKHILSGFGLGLIYNNRDNNNYTMNGFYTAFKTTIFDDFLGSDYSFFKNEIDTRYFLPLSKKSVIANQFLFRWVDGDCNFQELPDLGDNLRGYLANKYSDKFMELLIFEFRTFPFEGKQWKKVGFAAFAESGQVAGTFNNLRLDRTKYSFGLGLRYALIQEERINLRMDISFDEDSDKPGVLFMGLEQF